MSPISFLAQPAPESPELLCKSSSGLHTMYDTSSHTPPPNQKWSRTSIHRMTLSVTGVKKRLSRRNSQTPSSRWDVHRHMNTSAPTTDWLHAFRWAATLFLRPSWHRLEQLVACPPPSNLLHRNRHLRHHVAPPWSALLWEDALPHLAPCGDSVLPQCTYVDTGVLRSRFPPEVPNTCDW